MSHYEGFFVINWIKMDIFAKCPFFSQLMCIWIDINLFLGVINYNKMSLCLEGVCMLCKGEEEILLIAPEEAWTVRFVFWHWDVVIVFSLFFCIPVNSLGFRVYTEIQERKWYLWEFPLWPCLHIQFMGACLQLPLLQFE